LMEHERLQAPMQQKTRHARLRLLIRKLNTERKSQAQKIDIICNDLISAQRDYIKALNRISFEASFYESLLASAGLDELLRVAAGLIEHQIPGTMVSFLLRRSERFEWHGCRTENLTSPPTEQFKKHIEEDLAVNICTLNKACNVADAYPFEYQQETEGFGKHSVMAVPLTIEKVCAGAILIWHSEESRPKQEQLADIGAVSSGLAKAIAISQVLSIAKN